MDHGVKRLNLRDGVAPPVIGTVVQSVLAQHGLTLTLGRAPEEVLTQPTPRPAPQRPTEEQREVERIQAKFSAFSFKDMGVMSKSASAWIRARRPQMEEEAAGLLLWDGLNLWYELAIEVGRIYEPTSSMKINAQRFENIEPQLAAVLEDGMRRTRARLASWLNDQLVDELVRLEREKDRAVQDERDLICAANQAALDEASHARRELQAASAQLTREREAHAHELARLRDQVEQERRATVERERNTRNEIAQLKRDLTASREVVAHLNAECERLEAAAHASPSPTPPENLPMPQTHTFGTVLDASSFTCFLKGKSVAATFQGCTVTAQIAVTPALLASWEAAYPTAQDRRRQLAAAIARPTAG